MKASSVHPGQWIAENKVIRPVNEFDVWKNRPGEWSAFESFAKKHTYATDLYGTYNADDLGEVVWQYRIYGIANNYWTFDSSDYKGKGKRQFLTLKPHPMSKEPLNELDNATDPYRMAAEYMSKETTPTAGLQVEDIKILNLYAGIGGNRRLWPNEWKVTAVEYNPEIAEVYKVLYPNDTVIIGDAHEYLLKNFAEYDAIWSSPPCQTHSRMRYHLQVGCRGQEMKYPDFRLYEEILFLKTHFKGNYVVENVVPYYEPLMAAQKLHRHLYWSNVLLSDFKLPHENLRAIQIPALQMLHGIDLTPFKLKDKRQILRNCVSPAAGLSIMQDIVRSLN